MSAQFFNGVRVEGAADQLKIINESDKPVIGYAVQRITDAGVKLISNVVLFDWVATGKAIQPGEEQAFGILLMLA